MEDRSRILCVASAYDEKFYFNERFKTLPETIKEELQIICVLFASDVGGIITFEYTDDGRLLINVTNEEGDLLFDEIGSVLKVKEIQREKIELLESLELYYKTFYIK